MDDDVDYDGHEDDVGAEGIEATEETSDDDAPDDSGVGAAIALLVALLAFLLAVAFIILRHVLFGA